MHNINIYIFIFDLREDDGILIQLLFYLIMFFPNAKN